MQTNKVFFATVVLITLLVAFVSCSAPTAPQFTPPDPNAKRLPTVIIDAGHGGEDGGAVGKNGVYEKDLNLKIALELKEMLETKGVSVRLTRTDDTLLYDRNTNYEGRKKALDMAARLAIINEYKNAVFVSIHMNSFPQEKYNGLQVYYSENDPTSIELAKIIQSLTISNLQPENNRKVKPSGGDIYLLEKTGHPAVLVECGFLSNADECELLCTDGYRGRLCLTLCTAIFKYFEGYVNNS
jgi:N-acetylmuramoyl-L-alanine amidase